MSHSLHSLCFQYIPRIYFFVLPFLILVKRHKNASTAEPWCVCVSPCVTQLQALQCLSDQGIGQDSGEEGGEGGLPDMLTSLQVLFSSTFPSGQMHRAPDGFSRHMKSHVILRHGLVAAERKESKKTHQKIKIHLDTSNQEGRSDDMMWVL